MIHRTFDGYCCKIFEARFSGFTPYFTSGRNVQPSYSIAESGLIRQNSIMQFTRSNNNSKMMAKMFDFSLFYMISCHDINAAHRLNFYIYIHGPRKKTHCAGMMRSPCSASCPNPPNRPMLSNRHPSYLSCIILPKNAQA